MRAPGRGRQSGVASTIFVLLLLGMVLVGLLALLNMSASGTTDTGAQQDSVAALYLAESGVERAISRFDGTNCTALGEAAITLGRGSFTISNGATTDYVGAALPSNECRVPVTGVVDNASRSVDVIVRAGSGGSGIAYDRSRNTRSNNGSTFNWNHRVGNGVSNGLLIVGVGIDLNGGGGPTVQSVTYAGVPMQPYDTVNYATSGFGGNDVRTELFYLANPPTGNHPVSVSLTGSTRAIGASVSFSGVDQANPVDLPPGLGGGNGWNPSATITTTAGNYWLVDVITVRGNRYPSPTSGQTVQESRATNGGGNRIRLRLATEGPNSPAGGETQTWFLLGGDRWALAVAGLRPATGSGTVVGWREVEHP
jgi:hypothetical protein